MEVNIIKLENGKEYIIIDALEFDDKKYFVLVNESEDDDYQIRRVFVEDGKEYLSKLEDEDEFDEVLLKFKEKHLERVDE